MKRAADSSSPPPSKRAKCDESAAAPEDECLYTSLKYRRLTFGTSNFLISLGLTTNLTLNTILLGLNLLHRALGSLSFKHLRRRALCAACLSLAWKQLEDREGSRHGPKIRDLVKGIFLLTQKQGATLTLPVAMTELSPQVDPTSAAHVAGVAANLWACRDGGAEMMRIREQIKLYEVLLLRAFEFKIASKDLALFPGQVAFAINRLMPSLAEGSVKMFDTVQAAALGIVMDFYRWPICLNYDMARVCDAAVFKASLALRMPVVPPVEGDCPAGLEIAFGSDEISNILSDLRQMYDWCEEIAFEDP